MSRKERSTLMNEAISRKIGIRNAVLDLFKEIPALAVFIVFLLYSIIFVPRFSNPQNLFNILVQSSQLIILACGMTFVFINGSIDFSVTAVLALASVFGAMIMTMGESVWLVVLALIVMFATGIVIGAINGLSVTRLRMPSFIATMATSLIFSGIALTITQSNSIGGLPDAFMTISRGTLVVIPIPVAITLCVVVLAIFVVTKTVFGKRLTAVGTNQRTAFISGIPVRKSVFSVFVISGFLASLASIVMTATLGAGLPALGNNMLMDIVSAVVIGGTSVYGGKGNLFGTFIAAIFVVTLNNSLNLMDMNWYLINVFKGVLLLVCTFYATLRFLHK